MKRPLEHKEIKALKKILMREARKYLRLLNLFLPTKQTAVVVHHLELLPVKLGKRKRYDGWLILVTPRGELSTNSPKRFVLGIRRTITINLKNTGYTKIGDLRPEILRLSNSSIIRIWLWGNVEETPICTSWSDNPLEWQKELCITNETII